MCPSPDPVQLWAHGAGVGPPQWPSQCWSEREVTLRGAGSPSRPAGFLWPRSGPCGLWVSPSLRCGRKCTESLHPRPHSLLLGPQFPHVGTRGVCVPVVVSVGHQREGRAAFAGPVPEVRAWLTLLDHRRGWGARPLRGAASAPEVGVLCSGRLYLVRWGSAGQLRVQWAHLGHQPSC